MDSCYSACQFHQVDQGGSGEHASQMQRSTSQRDQSPTHFDGTYYEDLPSLQASPIQYACEKNEKLGWNNQYFVSSGILWFESAMTIDTLESHGTTRFVNNVIT